MDRITRLTQLWNWLPAFRAVAETEHLPTAARAMRLSASALSRSVSQLEAALEQPVFVRSRRRLQLNSAGVELLTAVRDAMRRIDDGLGRLASTEPTSVRAAGDSAWIGLLVAHAADAAVRIEHVEPHGELRGLLLRGLIDIALVETVAPSDDLVVERLGTVARSVCTARHSSSLAFAVCTTGTNTWPLELPRTIALRSARLDPVIEACRSGAMRAVLPTVIAKSLGLRVHAKPALPPSQLYLVRRVPLGTSAAETLVPTIRRRARELLQ